MSEIPKRPADAWIKQFVDLDDPLLLHEHAIAKELWEAVQAMVGDGWLSCGSEGMSEAQQTVSDAIVNVSASGWTP